MEAFPNRISIPEYVMIKLITWFKHAALQYYLFYSYHRMLLQMSLFHFKCINCCFISYSKAVQTMSLFWLKRIKGWPALLAFLFCAPFYHDLYAQETDRRYLQEFDQVRVQNRFTVELSQGPFLVEVQAEPESMPYILTEIKGKTLIISHSKPKELKGKKNRIRIRVHLPELTELALEHQAHVVGNFEFKGDKCKLKIKDQSQLDLKLKFNSLSLSMNDQSIVRLRGKTEKLDLKMGHQSILKAKQLNIDNLDAHLDDQSIAELTVKKKLSADLNNQSILNYHADGKGLKVKNVSLKNGAVLNAEDR